MESSSEMSLDELLWTLKNILAEEQIDENEEELHLLLSFFQSKCPYEPFEARPWTMTDFDFNIIILRSLDILS